MNLPNKAPAVINEIAAAVGGKVEEVGGPFSDGSGFAVMSMPLPKGHWLTADGDNNPPMPLRIGTQEHGNRVWPAVDNRQQAAEMVRAAARYAIRSATMNGQVTDFDPDAMVQQFVVGMLGYWTPNGLSRMDGHDEAPRG